MTSGSKLFCIELSSTGVSKISELWRRKKHVMRGYSKSEIEPWFFYAHPWLCWSSCCFNVVMLFVIGLERFVAQGCSFWALGLDLSFYVPLTSKCLFKAAACF